MTPPYLSWACADSKLPFTENTPPGYQPLVNGVDVILGESWLKSHRVVLNYATMQVKLQNHKGDKITLKPKRDIVDAQTVRQAVRAIKRGARPFFMVVQYVRERLTICTRQTGAAQQRHAIPAHSTSA